MSNLYFTGTEVNVIAANAQISGNCGLPFGGTKTWADPQSEYIEPIKWFIKMPDPEGWTREDGTHFTQKEMISGVVNVDIEESNPDWWPPSPFPPK